uniref:RNA polymerase-associated protein CTR9-like protein n=1 Tax=Panagrolaimus sp. JU765 TaxID=591449 RepID=A0AC34QS80_9BILA
MTEHFDAGGDAEDAIFIPTTSGEKIGITLSDLPDVQDIRELLVDEMVPLAYWPQLAKLYYIAGRFTDFISLLEQHDKAFDSSVAKKDKVQCMDMLAAFYVRAAMKAKDTNNRKMYFNKATMLYTTADKIIIYDLNHLIGRAYFCLVESVKWEQAKTQFEYVLKLQEKDIMAVIGMGLVYYHSGNYNAAVKNFKQALRSNPDLPAEIRLGLGHCFMKLKNYSKAKFAYERVLSLDKSNIPARIALASCIFHEGHREQAEKIWKAINIKEPDNPIVLNHLANASFLKNNFVEAESLAWRAYEKCENNYCSSEVRAEAAFTLGRCHHIRKEFDRAGEFYKKAIEFKPKCIPAYLGLGRIKLSRGLFQEAVDDFEKVLAEYPDDLDLLKILGSIYARWEGPVEDDKQRECKKKATNYLTRVYEECPDDVEVIIELAQLQEGIKPDEALKKYEIAIDLMIKTNAEVPPEMLVNIANLLCQVSDFKRANRFYWKAKDLMVAAEEDEAKILIVLYNIARFYEDQGFIPRAERIYNAILTKKPTFSDVILRIGCMYRNRGDSMKALTKFKEAIAIDTEDALPWLFIANVHMDKGETKLAQSNYEHVLKSKDHKNHPYALIGLGNVWMDALYSVRSGEKDEKERIKKCRDNAFQMYLSALKHHPHNAWAANGVACVLVHQGKLSDAREILLQIREAAPEMADVYLNLAHIHMELKQYLVASQMYKSHMKKFDLYNDVQLLQYCARAAWKATNYADAREFLQRAAVYDRKNLLVRYNLAIILQSMACLVTRDQKATLRQLEGAVDDLEGAENVYTYLASQPDAVIAKFRYVSRTTCQKEARSCKDLLAQAKQIYESALKKETKEREQQELLKKQRQEQLRQKEEEEAAKAELQKKQEEELRKQREQYVAKTKEILASTQTMEDKIKEKEIKKKGGKRRKAKDEDDFVNDSSDMGEWRGEPGAERPRKKKKEKRKRRRDGADGEQRSGSEGENKAPRRKKKKRSERSDREPDREETFGKKGKFKSQAYVSSSSSSDSDTNVATTSQPTLANLPDDDLPPPMIDSDESSSSSSPGTPPATPSPERDDDDE